MIDFPNSPTAGQIFQAAGLTFLYDGVKWKAIAPLPSNNIGRNILHNGLFNIQQRGAPGWSPAVGTITYTADRWFIYSNATGDAINAQLYAHTDTSRAQIGDEAAEWFIEPVVTGGTGANNMCMLTQRIEDVKRLSGKAVTVSWWGNCAPNMNVGISLAQVFGSGGSPSTSVFVSSSVLMTAPWIRYSVTLNLPSVAGKTFGTTVGTDFTQLAFVLSCPSGAGGYPIIGAQSGTFNFWGMQLEIGNTPSPLEKIEPRIGQANCMRFYQVFYPIMLSGNAASPGNVFYSGVPLTVPMRAGPTVTFAGTAYSNASALTNWATTQQALGYMITATAAGYCYGYGTANLSADL